MRMAPGFRRLFAAFVAALAAAPASAQDVVRVGHLGIAADAPFYIALEKGWFRDAGIEIRFDTFASAVQAMAPLAGGELQVAGGGIGPGLFNAYARAFPVRVVAARTRDIHGNAGNVLMVRNDLAGQVRGGADLRGRKVAINAPGSPNVYMVAKLIESSGLAIKDAELVYMPWPDMGAAFEKKAIDVGSLIDPFTSAYAEKGYASVWLRSSDIIKGQGWEVAVLFYNDDWARKNPRVANEFMVAYLKGGRYMMQAWSGGPNRAEVVDILVKHTRIKDRALYEKMHWGHMDVNGRILRDSIRDQQEFFARIGQVPKKVDIDAIIDERYLAYALQKVGVQN